MIAGPFGKQEPVRRYSGIYIYRCANLSEAKELNQKDPSIAAGYFKADVIPWFGPRSLGY